MKRKMIIILLVLMLLTLGSASAQTRFGVRGGIYNENRLGQKSAGILAAASMCQSAANPIWRPIAATCSSTTISRPCLASVN
ncbi:MAG: hypothetical protein ONB46_14550 [candidate division KSB1 bacterium]|nr:hypothetical protein [candidate division KSB1 bacterium]MDZ7364274.1 hypothetical protein [candidate division KSB1 bacterium]MDZ7404997.1 hypothetical protein [candidate division KSB1 bacterium]